MNYRKKKQYLNDYIGYLNENFDYLKKSYDEQYQFIYGNNTYRIDDNISLRLNQIEFAKFYEKTINFLKKQLEFINKMILLDYVKKEGILSEYTEQLINECFYSLRSYYNFGQEDINFFYNALQQVDIAKNIQE